MPVSTHELITRLSTVKELRKHLVEMLSMQKISYQLITNMCKNFYIDFWLIVLLINICQLQAWGPFY